MLSGTIGSDSDEGLVEGIPALRGGCIWMGINGDSPVRRRVIGEENFLSRVRKNTGRTEKPLILDARFSHNIPRQRGNSPKSSEI